MRGVREAGCQAAVAETGGKQSLAREVIMEAAGGPAAGRGSATACSPSTLRGVRALLDADSLKRSADEAELGAEATPEAESSGSETPGSTRSHVWDELDSLRAAASGNTLNAVGMPWGSLSKRHRSLPMPPRVPSAVMTDDDKDKIVYKSKLSKGDINGVESGANLVRPTSTCSFATHFLIQL